MLTQTQGIVVSQVSYGDTSAVAKIFTRQFGLLGFMVKGLKGGKGSIRPSHLMQLNLVELVMYKKENQGLQIIKELRCVPLLPNLHVHPLKSCISLFVAEVLQRALQENHPDEHLFKYIYQKILELDSTQEPMANFPLHFLLGLSHNLGFWPKGHYENEDTVFDLEEGVFVQTPYPGHHTAAKPSPEYIQQLMQSDNSNWHIPQIPKNDRIVCLDVLVDYFRLHMLQRQEIKSHKVLREVLG
ncbi:MAG: DNA repair protein RecO [Flavobacteriaceae bacterium]|nr:DNA repair protein RecO [Flavobacteriaceae bacterium]